MNRSTFDNVRERVREYFLQEQAERRSSAMSAAQRSAIRAYYDAAEALAVIAAKFKEAPVIPSGVSPLAAERLRTIKTPRRARWP